MSQAESVTGSKAQGAKERVETFLRTFEWTWTNAVLFSLVFVFFIVISTSVIPSFWLYFADQKLQWDGGAAHQLLWFNVQGFWLKELRDAVAMGLVTIPFIAILVVASVMQNWRKKLRGSGGGSRPSGGYR
jgi:hypothetical protein